MKRILLYDINTLDRTVTSKILSERMLDAQIIAVASLEEALAYLRKQEVHLVIADIPRFDMTHYNIIAEIKKNAAKTPILLTSTVNCKDITGTIWRLGVQDYLLKPYRPAWLIAAVATMTDTPIGKAPQSEPQYLEQYLSQLKTHLTTFNYKKCVDTARDYLDFLYENADNIAEIRANALAFAEGITQQLELQDNAVQWKLNGILEHYRLRFDLQGRKFDTFATYEKILDTIFEIIEHSNFYKVSSEQKILNYIDRRAKQGISLDDAADYANMSSCYFSKMFKKITGNTFISYVTDCKIEIAKQMLLNTDMPVINIAYDLSYSETNYFSKAFKKKVGITPTEYRETSASTGARCG